MKRIIPAVLILISLFIAGCQTTLPEQKPGKTQLVIPLNNEKESGATPFGSYYAVITDKATGKDAADVRLSPVDEYALYMKLSPGEYYISQTYFQFTSSKEIPDSERKFYEEDFAPITMKEGTITLCPIVFSSETTRGSGVKMPVTMDLSVYKDKGTVRGDEILLLLKTKYPKEYPTWTIQE